MDLQFIVSLEYSGWELFPTDYMNNHLSSELIPGISETG